MMTKVLIIFPLLIALCLGGKLRRTVHAGDEGYLKDFGINDQGAVRGARIAGGTEALRNQFPYQVGFFVYVRDGQSVCGGSVLSSVFVLSAAHCFSSFESADLLAGIHNILDDTALYELEVFPSDVIIHEQYNGVTNLNDIALVRTNRRPMTFSAAIQPLPLAPLSMVNTDLTNSLATIAGWGRINDKVSDISPKLLFIQVPIISNADCTRTFGNVITASNICLSGANARSTCQGDSGGPLTVMNGGRPVHIGIVSFGSKLGCQLGHVTVFARITSFHTWIRSKTGIVIA